MTVEYKMNQINVKHLQIFLFNIRKHHSNKIIMAHININFLRNKFDMLTNSVSEYIDIHDF